MGELSPACLLTPSKSPPLPVRGVVGIVFDRCITLKLLMPHGESVGMFMKFPSRTANPLKYLFLASKRIVQWHMSGPNLQVCKNDNYYNTEYIFTLNVLHHYSWRMDEEVHFRNYRLIRVEYSEVGVVLLNFMM